MQEDKVTFCRICEAACGLVAKVEEGRVKALVPDPEHVVSKGYACVKGTRFAEVHNSPDRLRHPLKRVGGRWERVSWEQALSEIGEKVRALRAAHGKDSIGMYVGNPAAFSLPHPAFASGFMVGLRSKQYYTAGTQDCSNKFAASWEMFGSPAIQPVPDFDRVRCFVIIGSNPAISQMSFIHAPRPIERLKAIEKRGGKVVFVNPRRTESADQVGEQLFIRPDTDVFFLLSFAHELVAQGGVDRKVLEHLDNLPELERVVKPWPAERTAQVTGIAPERLRELVRSYLAVGASALYASTGLNQGRNGTLAIWLLNAINAVSGNLDRHGGVLVPRGLTNVPLLAKLSGTGHHRYRSRIDGLPAVLDAFPAAILPDEITTPGEGQLRGLFVSAGNPVLSCPNSARMADALSQLELLVSIDLFRNETGNLAHYVLPATSFLERGDLPLGVSGFHPVPYVQYSAPVVPPDGEQRDEWWIFTRLAEACGVNLFGSKAAQRYLAWSAREGRTPFDFAKFTPERMYRAMVRACGETTFGALLRNPHGVLLRDNREHDFLGKRSRVLRPGAKVDVAPPAFVEAAAGLDALFDDELRAGRRLKLITKRERTSHNSWMHNVEAFVKRPRDTNYLYMHPDDAAALGLRDGDLADVSTETGRVRVPVKYSDDMMLGAVALPHGWGHAGADGLSIASATRGVNANALASDGPRAVERLSGMAHLTGIPVEVRPAPSAAE